MTPGVALKTLKLLRNPKILLWQLKQMKLLALTKREVVFRTTQQRFKLQSSSRKPLYFARYRTQTHRKYIRQITSTQ